AGDPCRSLQQVPPVLHRQAEAGGHRRPCRALQAPLRQREGWQVRSRNAIPQAAGPSAVSLYLPQKGQQPRTAAPNASISPFENPFGRKVKQNRALVAYAPRTQFCFTFL